jgi:transposase
MEIARLRADNAQLKMARDILEKATAYFAKVRQSSTPGLSATAATGLYRWLARYWG